jgi:transcription antitermination protein NusB
MLVTLFYRRENYLCPSTKKEFFMITRRNIRTKVMQLIYSTESAEGQLMPKDSEKKMLAALENTKTLFFFLTKSLMEITLYAEVDSKNKASKHLPTAEDLNVNTKIAGNTVVWHIVEAADYQVYNANKKITALFDEEWIKAMYLELVATEEYKQYINVAARTNKEDVAILKFILDSIILPNENYQELGEETFTNWDDDIEMARSVLMAQLERSKQFTINKIIGLDKTEFAINLAKTYFDKKELLATYYIPKLRNWDENRIAVLDKVIISLGITELLFFENIPAKVTINEYIDLAKDYSTKQSGHFVNGVLDGIHKDLVRDNKLNKTIPVKPKA